MGYTVYTAKRRWSPWDRSMDAVCTRNGRSGSAQAAWCCRLCRSSNAVRSPMVALSACPGRRAVVAWASHRRRGHRGNAIGLTGVAHQSAVRAQHCPYCSHTEERFSYIRRPHGDLVDSLGRHGRSVVAALCDGGFTYTCMNYALPFVYFSSKEVCTGLRWQYIEGLVMLLQECSNSIANALELQQSCTKPSTCTWKCKEWQNRALPRRM